MWPKGKIQEACNSHTAAHQLAQSRIATGILWDSPGVPESARALPAGLGAGPGLFLWLRGSTAPLQFTSAPCHPPVFNMVCGPSLPPCPAFSQAPRFLPPAVSLPSPASPCVSRSRPSGPGIWGLSGGAYQSLSLSSSAAWPGPQWHERGLLRALSQQSSGGPGSGIHRPAEVRILANFSAVGF